MTDQPLRDREDAEAEPPEDLLEQTHTAPAVDGEDDAAREQSLTDD
jgi:hypothetical protein